MDLASYQALYKDNDAAPGWDAIDRALEGCIQTSGLSIMLPLLNICSVGQSQCW